MVKIIVMECHLMNITLPENERELDKKQNLGIVYYRHISRTEEVYSFYPFWI